MYNILVVEDDKRQRANLTRMIISNNNLYNVIESDNITDSIRISNEVNIDLFYIDVNLNGEFGLNLALKIRENKNYKLTMIRILYNHISHI